MFSWMTSYVGSAADKQNLSITSLLAISFTMITQLQNIEDIIMFIEYQHKYL